jgi:RNA polymerase sigma-70 factor (ECF subfamily)
VKKANLENTFLEMVRNNERVIFKIISFYANEDHPVNDLYQEVVINLWKAYPGFRGDCKESTWIYRIALNTCVTFFRKSKKTPVYVDITIDIPDMDDNKDDDIKTLYHLINKLGKIEKALVLLYLEEKSYKEMAEITGLTATNVATKLGRIKEKLRKMSNE